MTSLQPPIISIQNRGKGEDERILINVSGRRYETLRSILETYPGTLLGSAKRERFYDAKTSEYFLLRDPDMFRHILNYYHTGKLHYPRNECLASYDEELLFFGIAPDFNLSECCFAKYHDRKMENTERLMDDEKVESEVSPTNMKEKIWRALNNPLSSVFAFVFYCVTVLIFAVYMTGQLAETLSCGWRPGRADFLSCGEQYANFFSFVETICVMLFTSEYLLRLFTAPNKFKFMFSVLSLIDLIVILKFCHGFYDPRYRNVAFAFGSLRIWRILRIFKFSRHTQHLRVLGSAMKSCVLDLGLLTVSVILTMPFFAIILYHAEKDVVGTSFTSVLATFWYTLITITSVGYGDMVPETILGKIFGSVCSIGGLFIIMLPIPIIMSNFNRIYQQHQKQDKRKAQLDARIAKCVVSNG